MDDKMLSENHKHATKIQLCCRGSLGVWCAVKQSNYIKIYFMPMEHNFKGGGGCGFCGGDGNGDKSGCCLAAIETAHIPC